MAAVRKKPIVFSRYPNGEPKDWSLLPDIDQVPTETGLLTWEDAMHSKAALSDAVVVHCECLQYRSVNEISKQTLALCDAREAPQKPQGDTIPASSLSGDGLTDQARVGHPPHSQD